MDPLAFIPFHVTSFHLSVFGDGGLHVTAVLSHLCRYKVTIAMAGSSLRVASRHIILFVCVFVFAHLTGRCLAERLKIVTSALIVRLELQVTFGAIRSH